MHPEGSKRRKVWLTLCLLFSLVVWGGAALLGDQEEEPILSSALVADLERRCDPDEIYEKAWEGTLQRLRHDEVDTFDFGRLGAEVMQILVGCFEKKLAEFDCESLACGDVRDALPRLKGLYVKYFRFFEDERYAGINTSALYPSEGVPAWDKYQEKMDACYRSVFEACDCDLDSLLALWADLALDDLNWAPRGAELADEILAKYEECLIERIASMTDVEAMGDLVLERDPETWFRYLGEREVTFYNNQTVACAVLKRLIELYRLDEKDVVDRDHSLDEEDVERYICSSCCDTVWLLQWMLGLMRSYAIWKCPETGWQEGPGCDLSGLRIFRWEAIARQDLYALCRKQQLNTLTADCDPNAFCRLLACKAHGVAGYEEALEAQLDDPREAEFLRAFKERLEECLGESAELEDVVEWCVKIPSHKTWDGLRQATGDDSAATAETGSIAFLEIPDLGASSGLTVTPVVPSTSVDVPQEISSFARMLAWKGAQFGLSDPAQRWDACEEHPGEYCEPCGHTPMCAVCMEWDLQEWQTTRSKSITDLMALMAVFSYLAQVAGSDEYEAIASLYWDAHWDGWHNRNRPW